MQVDYEDIPMNPSVAKGLVKNDIHDPVFRNVNAPFPPFIMIIVAFISLMAILGGSKNQNTNRRNNYVTERGQTNKYNIRENNSYLLVKTYPWSKVYVDNEFIGNAPFVQKKEISPGLHKIKLQNEKYKSYTFDKKIEEGQVIEIEANLAREIINIK